MYLLIRDHTWFFGFFLVFKSLNYSILIDILNNLSVNIFLDGPSPLITKDDIAL